MSLRSQFYLLIVPFTGVLIALLFAALAPYYAAHRDIQRVKRELSYTLTVQAFSDSFAGQTREYADFIVSGAPADGEQARVATAAALRSLAEWRQLAEGDESQELEIVRRVSVEHATVMELNKTILRLCAEGRREEAAAVLTEQIVPLMTSVSREVDRDLLAHQSHVSRLIARITDGMEYSKLLQFGGMLKGLEDLDSHVAEVIDSISYKSAVERELRGYWYFFLSKGQGRNDSVADHARVMAALTTWRAAVGKYVRAHAGEPDEVDELRTVEAVQRDYLLLHGRGEQVIRLVTQGSHQQAEELLRQTLEFDETTVARTMGRYTKHETDIAGQNLQYLRSQARRAQLIFLGSGLVVLLSGLGLPWGLSRRMIQPIEELQRAALRIGGGDLDTRIHVSSTTELGSLATTFNDMTRELKISRNEDLRKSEERFQLAARATNDVFWEWNPITKACWVSEAFARQFGYPSAGDIDVQLWYGAIHPDDTSRLFAGVDRTLSTGEAFYTHEYRFRRADGTYADILDRAHIVRDAQGQAVRVIGAMTDITERKAGEQAIASLHRHREMILNSVADGIIGLDAQGVITSANPAALRMLGFDEDDLLGTPVHQVLHCGGAEGTPGRREDSPMHMTLFGGSLQSSAEELCWRADGSSFPADYVSNPMWDEKGKVAGAVVTFRDITEKQEVERLKSQFVSTVSHELRTPLTSIRGALGLLSGGLLGEVSTKGQRMLEIAVTNTDRLVRLINDILDVERIEGGSMEVSRTVLNAVDLMKRAAEGIQSMADGAEVSLLIEPSEASVLGDEDRLVQTLMNLMGNAIKFSPPGTAVTVAATSAGGECTFSVADQGRGVPQDKLEMIFERFQQVDASDSRTKGGSGLGLAICRSIVSAHGGRIWAERNAPAGTVFRFTIPSAIPLATRGATSPARTLVVCQSDDSSMPDMVEMLKSHEFHVLRRAEFEVLSTSSAVQPEAIVLDLAGGGWRLVEALKADPSTRDIPIVITPRSAESWENYSTGVARWIRKSLGSADLLDAVVEACSAPSILVVEDDFDLAGVMIAILQKHGIRTFHAANGREAVELCRQHDPSLIVLDLILPEVDGFGVVRALKESPQLCQVPLLVYSGLDVGSVDQERLRLGPTEFLTKSRDSLHEFEAHVVRLLHTVTTQKEKAPDAA